MENERVEISLARRVVERFDLTPPLFNLDDVIKTYANLVVHHLPVPIDGATLYVAGDKPTVLINQGRSARRTRFTKAHELGHVLLPSHQGDVIDPDIESGYHDWRENEANTFAAEVLMPDRWMKLQAAEHTEPLTLVQAVSTECHVSNLAANFRTIAYLPPGFIFARCAADGMVLYSGRSEGTFTNQPYRGDFVINANHFSLAESNWELRQANGEITRWWKFPRSLEITSLPVCSEWQGVLDEIMTDLKALGIETVFLRQSLNGVLGAANGALKGERITEGEIVAACLQRVHHRASEDATYRSLLEHPKFTSFLACKAHDLFEKRSLKR